MCDQLDNIAAQVIGIDEPDNVVGPKRDVARDFINTAYDFRKKLADPNLSDAQRLAFKEELMQAAKDFADDLNNGYGGVYLDSSKWNIGEVNILPRDDIKDLSRQAVGIISSTADDIGFDLNSLSNSDLEIFVDEYDPASISSAPPKLEF